MEYEDRIVAFIDILGFKNLINGTIDIKGHCIEKNIDLIFDTLLDIRDFLDIDQPEKYPEESTQITQFSDSIVISFRVNEKGGVYQTLNILQMLIIKLIFRQIIIRGGIAFGPLIHNEKTVFGPGLNTAYEMESKAALFPRVILDKSILAIGKKNHSSHHLPKHELDGLKGIVTKDTDNMYYIDYFEKAFGNLNEPEDIPDYIDNIRETILPYAHTTKPDLKVKYGWMINKFNIMIKKTMIKKRHKEFLINVNE